MGRIRRILAALVRRLPWVATMAGLALAWRFCAATPPEQSAAGVEQLLGEAVGAEVAGAVWEESSGSWLDFLVGRRILFLAGAPRDVYRARVRVTREGKVLSVLAVHRLTSTAEGDEVGLVARRRQAAFGVQSASGFHGVVVLTPGQEDDDWPARLGRLLQTGAVEPVERVEVAFGEPPREARFELTDDAVVLALGQPPEPARLDLHSLEITGGRGLKAAAWRRPERRSPLSLASFEERPAAPDAPLEPLALAVDATTPPSATWPPAAATAWPNLPAAAGGHRGYLARGGDDGVRLVSLDTRLLSLHGAAGDSEPALAVGPGLRGRVRPSHHLGLVAAFSGTGRQEGLAVDGRRLVPPQPELPSVAVARGGELWLGAWPYGPALPATVTQLRQSPGCSDAGEQAALCRTRAGQLVYAWSAEVTREGLAAVLARQDCVAALCLPGSDHAFTAFTEAPGDELVAEPLSETMDRPERFLTGTRRDFFYLRLREMGPAEEGLSWQVAPGQQPAPAWLPAIFTAELDREVPITLWSIDHARFRWDIVPGDREAAGDTADDALPAAPLIVVGLGVGARRDNRRGLSLDGQEVLPIRPDLGVLTTGLEQGLHIGWAPPHLAPRADASELVLTAEAGRIRSEARRIGHRRERAQACLHQGRLWLALAVADSPLPATKLLMSLGCERVVDLDRGGQIRAFVHRAGVDTIAERYDDTVLVGTAAPAYGNAADFPR